MAWHGETLAGVAILMLCGKALLTQAQRCRSFAEMGCHVALLAARIRRASEAGCRRIYSWAALGGRSQADLQKAGLAIVGTTTTWAAFAEDSL